MVVYYSDGSRGTTLYSRYLYQQQHGPLDKSITVDHIDENKKNDTLNNFQLLTFQDNDKKHKALNPAKLYKFKCPICNIDSIKLFRNVKHNWNMGKAGPFCSRQCARKYQLAGMVELADTADLSPAA